MIKVENISVMNLDGAMRALRNPMNSWEKSDSEYCYMTECKDCCWSSIDVNCDDENAENWTVGMCCNSPLFMEGVVRCSTYPENFVIGVEDLKLCQRMLNAGDSDSKFMRQIFVNMDIVAPTYFCAEFDTYKVATVRNSCSFMHKGTAKPFERSDFSFDNVDEHSMVMIDNMIAELNTLRDKYLETKDKEIFLAIRQMLPMGYNYRFTWSANYAVLRNIYFQRRNHRLPEWREFCRIIETFPYGKDLICYTKEEEK